MGDCSALPVTGGSPLPFVLIALACTIVGVAAVRTARTRAVPVVVLIALGAALTWPSAAIAAADCGPTTTDVAAISTSSTTDASSTIAAGSTSTTTVAGGVVAPTAAPPADPTTSTTSTSTTSTTDPANTTSTSTTSSTSTTEPTTSTTSTTSTSTTTTSTSTTTSSTTTTTSTTIAPPSATVTLSSAGICALAISLDGFAPNTNYPLTLQMWDAPPPLGSLVTTMSLADVATSAEGQALYLVPDQEPGVTYVAVAGGVASPPYTCFLPTTTTTTTTSTTASTSTTTSTSTTVAPAEPQLDIETVFDQGGGCRMRVILTGFEPSTTYELQMVMSYQPPPLAVPTLLNPVSVTTDESGSTVYLFDFGEPRFYYFARVGDFSTPYAVC